MCRFKGLFFALLVFCPSLRLVMGALTQAQLNELCKGFSLQAIAHPDGSSKFIFCSDKGATENACPPGTCFDSIGAACLKSVTGCQKTPANAEVSPENCNTENFLMKKIPSKDCGKYYMCTSYDMIPIEVKCPQGQHFSKFAEKCVDMTEAYCEPPQMWCKDQADGVTLKAKECFQYYKCSHQESILSECLHHEYFNGSACVQGTCTGSDGVSRVRKPNCLDHEEEYFPHSKCNMYYVCHNAMAWEVQCATGYYYDESVRKCEKDVKNVCF